VGDGERILVVGHEPYFSQVVHDLTGARVDFKKGGVAAVRLQGTTGGELLALLRPRDLAAVAAAAPEAA
jgi:phosphohistidine phosphatase